MDGSKSAWLKTPDALSIEVIDNGVGLPSEDRNRLTEPYVTKRAKGTGLGLAIVKKIMEDHKGVLSLEDAPKADETGASREERRVGQAHISAPFGRGANSQVNRP